MENQSTNSQLVKQIEELKKSLQQAEARIASETADRERAEQNLQDALAAAEDAKQAYLESEEHYKLLLENTQDIVYAVTPEGIMTHLGPQVRLFGYEPEEMISKNFVDFVAPAQRQEVIDKFEIGTAAGGSFPTQFQLINKDGSCTWVEAVGRTMFDESGNPVQQIGVLRDITQQKEIEDQLRRSEEIYRRLVEQISEVIYSVNLEGLITYVSPAVESFLGYSPAEVIGQPFAKFFVAEDLSSARENFGLVSGGGVLGTQEYKMLTRSGEVRWMQTSSHPVMEGDQVVGVQGVLADITHRKMAEKQLERDAATAERERLARELHDSVTQTLYTVAAIAEVLPRIWERDQVAARQGLGDLTTLTNAALAEMRTLLLELRPEALEKQNLAELLRQLSHGLEARTRMSIHLSIDEDCTMPSEVQIALYRIAQEALNNIVKHARASQAQVHLNCKPGQVEIHISDDGVGFNPQSVTSHCLGLEIMRERAQDIGAIFELDSQPEIGTQVSVLWQEQPEG